MAEKGMSQVASYRACFGTDAGKRVLEHLLTDAGYFDTDLFSEGDIAVQNFAKKIIKNLGVFRIVNKKVTGVDAYVNKLFELPSGE